MSKQRMESIVAEAEAIIDRARSLGRDMNLAESSEVDALFEEFNELEAGVDDALYFAKLRLKLVSPASGTR